jgi:hypothetical protein
MIWTVIIQRANEVLVSKITTKKAILKRRLAERNRLRIKRDVVWIGPDRRQA